MVGAGTTKQTCQRTTLAVTRTKRMMWQGQSFLSHREVTGELRAVGNQGERSIAAGWGRVSAKALGQIRFSSFERMGKPVWSRGVLRVGVTQRKLG